jgi:hypothetical protein
MAAKRLRAAPTRLARALFWLDRSPIALTRKRILEAPATPGRVCARSPLGLASILRQCSGSAALSSRQVSSSSPSRCKAAA